jgi:hypothetical protein
MMLLAVSAVHLPLYVAAVVTDSLAAACVTHPRTLLPACRAATVSKDEGAFGGSEDLYEKPLTVSGSTARLRGTLWAVPSYLGVFLPSRANRHAAPTTCASRSDDFEKLAHLVADLLFDCQGISADSLPHHSNAFVPPFPLI